eukprot:TRINITY_DN9047_c0_g1_i4.p1 TRINITY_DN9047_c0_g1~~TRINITY_DN9047_c0_g1_i4.p1  ORF type:complete len:384 (-),score=93.06 TRINITY_DN9047_c0_g1_i4:23-1174(-)
MFFPLREMSDEEMKRNTEEVTAGTVTLNICQAKNLPRMDKFGLSDPYCVIRLGKKEVKTKVVYKNLNPVWNQSFTFEVYDYENDKFLIEVYDEDTVGNDDMIGSFELPIRKIGEYHEHWYHMPQATGAVLIKGSYRSFHKETTPSTPVSKVEESKELPPLMPSIGKEGSSNLLLKKTSSEMSSMMQNSSGKSTQVSSLSIPDFDEPSHSISHASNTSRSNGARSSVGHLTPQASARSIGDDLRMPSSFYIFLKVISAEHLPTNALGVHFEHYVTVQLDDQYYETKVAKRSSHPTWEEEFKFTTVDVKDSCLHIFVKNHHTLGSDSKFASVTVPLHEIPFNIFVRESLELTFTNQKRLEKHKGEKPVLKIKLKVAPTSASNKIL